MQTPSPLLKRDVTPGLTQSESDRERNASSVNSFCERNNISRSLFYKQVRDGRLKVRKIGRRTIVLSEDEKAWRDALPAHATGEAA